jgi:foldase protein PrsA
MTEKKKATKEVAPKATEEIKEKAAPKKEVKAATKTKKKLSLGQMIVIGMVAVLALFIGLIGYLVYGAKNETAAIKNISRVVILPAGIVDNQYITVYSYLDQLDILKNYYKEFKSTDFNSEEGKKKLTEIRGDVANRLAEDAIVSSEAAKLKVKITKKEINDEYDRLIASNGGQKSFSEILQKYYGLTLDEFKNKIFAPRLLRQKLTEKINNNESETGVAKKKADELYAKAKAGEDFAKLATENSQDPGSAANGGDLGYFGKGKMVPEFETAAFAANVGDIVGPVKTVYGYHIIKITDKKDGQVKASHILIKTQDFNEWLTEKKTELKKKKLLGFIPAYWILVKTN